MKKNPLFFFLASNSPCNNVTEDCVTDPNNGTAICTCKIGYNRNSTTQNCTGMINPKKIKFFIDKSIHFCMQISMNVRPMPVIVMHKVHFVSIL